jgi:hypothetical protein
MAVTKSAFLIAFLWFIISYEIKAAPSRAVQISFFYSLIENINPFILRFFYFFVQFVISKCFSLYV